MNDLALPFAESLLDVLESKFAYVEWGTPNYIGHCYVYWDADARMVWEEDENYNRMVRVPEPRWKAGKCWQSFGDGKTAQFKEKRFEGLREALEWLTEPQT
jgi:hypothetical protein